MDSCLCWLSVAYLGFTRFPGKGVVTSANRVSEKNRKAATTKSRSPEKVNYSLANSIRNYDIIETESVDFGNDSVTLPRHSILSALTTDSSPEAKVNKDGTEYSPPWIPK